MEQADIELLAEKRGIAALRTNPSFIKLMEDQRDRVLQAEFTAMAIPPETEDRTARLTMLEWQTRRRIFNEIETFTLEAVEFVKQSEADDDERSDPDRANRNSW